MREIIVIFLFYIILVSCLQMLSRINVVINLNSLVRNGIAVIWFPHLFLYYNFIILTVYVYIILASVFL